MITKFSHRRGAVMRIHHAGWNRIRVGRGRHSRSIRLDDPDVTVRTAGGVVHLRLPDVAALANVARSGVLAGKIAELHVRIDQVFDWTTTGIRPPRVVRDQTMFSWSRNGDRLELSLAWRHPHDLHRALSDVLSATTRHRLFDSIGGPIYATDRRAWLTGRPVWPQSQITGKAPTPKTDDEGRPMGAYLPAPSSDSSTADPSLNAFSSLLANPYGRLLAGTAHRYRLQRASEHLVLTGDENVVVHLNSSQGSPESVFDIAKLNKYAAIECDDVPDASDHYAMHCLRVLSAGGAVMTAQNVDNRRQLRTMGLLTVDNPESVTDLHGYALSAAAARQAALRCDPVLRRTALCGEAEIAVPAVTAVMSSKRPDDVSTCLEYLAAQTYPSVEIVIGTHGYEIDDDTRQTWEKSVPFRLRVLAVPEDFTLGMALARVSAVADGDLVTKVDDDDHYGANHILDLVLAWHQSGADLVAKGARFVSLPDLGKTIDRRWAAREQFNATPAGGTLMLARSTLEQVGGWSTSPRRVDADLIARIRSRGGVTYRTHALGYVYVRRTAGHTWPTEIAELLKQSEATYEGLPELMITGDSRSASG